MSIPTSSRSRSSLKLRAVKSLSVASHASAIAFGGFLVVHLSAPIIAAIAPPDKAQEWAGKGMLLGRVYYQGTLEPVLVWGAWGVHLVASFGKRLVLLPSPKRWSLPSKLPSPTWHTLSAFILLPATLFHVLSTRVQPAQRALSAALDHSFVARGFETYPFFSTLVYAGLIGAGTVHFVGGATRIAKRLQARKAAAGRGTEVELSDGRVAGARATARAIDRQKERKKTQSRSDAIGLGAALWVALGLTRIVADGANVGKGLLLKYDACYQAAFKFL